MGTWDTGIFDNDEAGNFLSKLEWTSDYGMIVAEFDELLALGTGYVEIDIAHPTLAAAEVIAQALGYGRAPEFAKDIIAEWLELDCKQTLPVDLVDKAILACSRILEPPCEAIEGWEDPTDLEKFRLNIKGLIERLESAKNDTKK